MTKLRNIRRKQLARYLDYLCRVAPEAPAPGCIIREHNRRARRQLKRRSHHA